jgi:hypothetical protein
MELLLMKRFPLALAILLALALPVRNAKADTLIGNAAIACALGAGTLAASTYVGWVPALASGVLLAPLSGVVAANALIGCGIGFVGVISATLVGRVVDPNVIVTK